MSKDTTFWFKHDYNARNDEKILELRANFGVEGYGVYWMIVESMCETNNGGLKTTLIGGLSLGYGVAKEVLLKILSFCVNDVQLFYEKDGYYFSKRILDHKEMRKSLSDSGKKGAQNRKNKGGYGYPNADKIRIDKIRIDKKEETNVEFFNKKEENMIVPEMMVVWKKYKPDYFEVKDVDYPALLSIAYKIAKIKDWRKCDILNIKESDCLKSWDKVAKFILSHSFFSKLTLDSLSSDKMWQKVMEDINKSNVSANNGQINGFKRTVPNVAPEYAHLGKTAAELSQMAANGELEGWEL